MYQKKQGSQLDKIMSFENSQLDAGLRIFLFSYSDKISSQQKNFLSVLETCFLQRIEIDNNIEPKATITLSPTINFVSVSKLDDFSLEFNVDSLCVI